MFHAAPRIAGLGTVALAPIAHAQTRQAETRQAQMLTIAEATAIAKGAWIYAYPMMENYNTMYLQAVDAKSSTYVGRFNKFRHYSEPFTPANRDTYCQLAAGQLLLVDDALHAARPAALGQRHRPLLDRRSHQGIEIRRRRLAHAHGESRSAGRFRRQGELAAGPQRPVQPGGAYLRAEARTHERNVEAAAVAAGVIGPRCGDPCRGPVPARRRSR